MKRSELIEKAKCIQFPLYTGEYREYSDERIEKLPFIPNTNYIGMKRNDHHYQYSYTYNVVLPTICNLFNIDFDINDFNLIEHKYQEEGRIYDLSYILPKKDYKYHVKCYNYDVEYDCDVYGLRYNSGIKQYSWTTEYHKGYAFSHACSRIINKTLKNGKKLMISGDSQMIPSIIPLTNYFEEVWYFDNRTEPYKSFKKEYENVKFDCVLLAYYADKEDRYTKQNIG